MDVYLPIYSKGIWIGLLAVGPKYSGVPYSEINLMSTLANQTSVALENARLVEGILQVNLQLEIANTNLEKTKDELERLDKAKSDFISIAFPRDPDTAHGHSGLHPNAQRRPHDGREHLSPQPARRDCQWGGTPAQHCRKYVGCCQN